MGMNREPTRRELRVFGLGLGVILLLLAALALWRGRPAPWWGGLGGASLLFLLAGAAFPSRVRPVYRLWMPLANALGWLNTRLILFLVFTLVVTPLGVAMRLLGWAPPFRRPRGSPSTHWVAKEKEQRGPERFRQMF